MSRFLRRSLHGVEAYVPGEQPTDSRLIKLNTNENPYPPSPAVFEALAALDGERLRKYPDPLWAELRATASRVYDLPPECIAAGNGSDELLRLVLAAFVDADESVVFPDITYSLYETLAALHGARTVQVPLAEDFSFPEALAGTAGKVLFLCHPNAPTGIPADPDFVDRAVASFPGVVVIDEAYADFADVNYAALAGRHDNVLVLRTLSKGYSLCGMRVGFALGHRDLISALETVKDSYNLSVAAQVAGMAALADRDHVRRNCAHVRETRARLIARLVDLGLHVYPSQANFVFVRLGSPEQARGLVQHLRDNGLLVRYWARPRIDACVRITVGTDAQVDRLLDATQAFLAG